MQQLNISEFHGRASGKRIGIFAVFLVALTTVFWTASRSPQLEEKELMGDRSSISALAFDPVIVPTADDGVIKRVYAGTVNWYVTNWKGMTFGLLLAGTFLSILVMVTFTSSRSILVNTIAGMLIGTPMGICTNCAAPVAKSLDDGGSRLETSLATLFSSPTLNIVVVAMLFAMFPPEMALIKMGLTLLLILAAVPLLTRFFFVQENAGKEIGPVSCSLAGAPLVETWPEALKGAAAVWGKCFWFIIMTAVPLMLLAGVLGATAIELVPVETLSSLEFTWWGAILLAALGTFLPVPIAFDVILASVLMGAGLHVAYVMILLFTLGPFSIYPFMLLWRSISLRVVTASYVTVMVLGIVGGSSFHGYNLLRKSQIVAAAGQPDLSAIVDETCGAFSGGGSECEAYSWARFATLLPESAPYTCEAIGRIGDAAECREYDEGRRLLSDVETRLAAIQRCLEAGHEPDQRACLLRRTQAIITYLATGQADEGGRTTADLAYTMLGFQNECRDDACADAITLFRAHYVQDSALCEDLSTSRLRQYCSSHVNLRVAMQSGDLESCFWEAVDDRALCVAATPGPSVPQRMAACVRLVADSDIERCEVRLLHSSDVLNHPDACSTFQSTKGREHCPIAIEQWRRSRTAAKPNILVRAVRAILQRNTGFAVNVGALFVASGPADTYAYSDEPSRPIVEKSFQEQDGISVTYSEFSRPADSLRAQANAGAETLFRSLPTSAVGIETPLAFLNSGTIAAGDYDGDGWVDVLLSDANGLHLYRNLGALRFTRAVLEYDPAFQFPYGVVGFVDIDNDGDLDIFQAGHFNLIFVMNQGEGFADAPVRTVGLLKGYPIAAPFADVDRDGLLDVVVAFREQDAPNILLLNKGMTFAEAPQYVDRYHGQTWSALLSDVNSDGHMDLFIGNDFEESDEVFFGTDGGGLARITQSSGVFSGVSTFNMGYESADINNDLRLDVFSTEALMVEGVITNEDCADPSWTAEFRGACVEFHGKYRQIMSRAGGIVRCQELRIASWRANCAATKIVNAAHSTRDPSLCDILPESPSYLRRSCKEASVPKRATHHQIRFEDDLRQFHRNALHVQQADGTFAEESIEFGVAESYWAWNARIHDYDNDGWQDIYVVNGRAAAAAIRQLGGGKTPSVFFKNIGGTRFEDWAERYGVGDLLRAKTYAAEDFDLDGDIDILAQGIRTPYRLYLNGSAGRSNTNSIEFRVIDQRMNWFGIGTQVVIHYDGGAQLRELKSAGGFQSHNAPVVHFGLGPVTNVNRVELHWTDGTSTVLDGEFVANRRYTVERKREES